MKGSIKTVLASLRKNLGSQEDVGAEVYIERSRLGRIEVRKLKATSTERENLAKHLGSSVEDLFDENGKAKILPPPATTTEVGRVTDARRAADAVSGMHH